ncbi:hypothetical protein G7K71_08665 [Desulfofundulus sp. TPOSR]|uniref:hypothetical protein n=1 Tax=Desulfofundulus sp. TPOSR TaxID=2714340 RepID=UPI00140A8A53|nr:hypothetical protein [Desulfofundulus sp. TPOSR]NHM25468.1 hypothetical protein [Desulfofundulus sp. TPOSR]NHM27056.1 hypothetical protein [Desulfofundulus sp. TPOSR]
MDARMDRLIEVVRKIVIRLFPELAGRYHLTGRARVTGLTGGLVLQPVTRDGSDDPETPAVKCETLPYTLKVGNIVRLGFMYGDPSEPFVGVLSTAAIGTWAGGKIEIPGYGTRDALVVECLREHSRLVTMTAPVDDQGNPLPGASTSPLTRIEYRATLEDGDQVVALPIEEGERFIVVGKL